MKILLTAINAKYIHTSLAVRSLYHYVNCDDTEFVEFTINEHTADVLSEIYKKHCDAVLFSCYIWNIENVLEIAGSLKKISPKTQIIFGGPEVSFDSVDYMEKYPFIDAIMRGEGEETFCEFLDKGVDIDGITFRSGNKIIQNPARRLIENITDIPFPYDDEDIEKNKNKLIYYESSRGCPFQCSYCLSSTTHSVRFRNTDIVKKELLTFIKHGVRIVKFVDRTFNADRKRTCELIRFLLDNASKTAFHFEIAADLINDEMLSLLKKAPKGLFQLEIGVQSTNDDVIFAIDRKTDFEKIKSIVISLRDECSIHAHLDLIAGLPYEDIKSFKKSFDDVFTLKPDVLQLGFLKLLRGTKIRAEEEKFHYRYTEKPPYEVLCNDFMSYDDILLLKGVEDVFERYYNSGVFKRGMEFLLNEYNSPFEFFKELWMFFDSNGYSKVGQSRSTLYDILCKFEGGRNDEFRDVLKIDYLENNKGASTPRWSLAPYDKQLLKLRFDILDKNFIKEYLPEYENVPVKETVKYLHFEKFSYFNGKKEETILIFDNKYDRIIKI